ncbi:winged helix-turn-helix domain-containing protein [Sphingomonas aracearum]|uniref:Winged helix family transcriptional regulator n=1 Tax=Sphingomonas aracearum TaxID=2283317 RepID=A0A369VXS7_9SPHN|nr:winged helix-turn-helix domain-containing protein [Sphingomonas aracearum]RDE07118.1 winged helix family transcriptional regulator [Sphingomonas aracearum]
MWRVRGHSEDQALLAALAARGIALAREGSCDAALVDEPVGGLAEPRLMLVRGGEEAVAAMLDAGLEDAVTSDASPTLIAARLAALLRRPRGAELRVGSLVIARAERRVWREGRAVPLLPREYALLLHLAERAGEPVPRAALLQAVWGLRFDPGTNVVAVHVSRLRARIDRGFAAPMVQTVPGRGYRLVAGAAAP